MFTSVDKALVAIVMGILYLLNTFAGIEIGVSEAVVTTVIAGLTPILVWLIPNRTN